MAFTPLRRAVIWVAVRVATLRRTRIGSGAGWAAAAAGSRAATAVTAAAASARARRRARGRRTGLRCEDVGIADLLEPLANGDGDRPGRGRSLALGASQGKLFLRSYARGR